MKSGSGGKRREAEGSGGKRREGRKAEGSEGKRREAEESGEAEARALTPPPTTLTLADRGDQP